jgi:hypothetical protein
MSVQALANISVGSRCGEPSGHTPDVGVADLELLAAGHGHRSSMDPPVLWIGVEF